MIVTLNEQAMSTLETAGFCFAKTTTGKTVIVELEESE